MIITINIKLIASPDASPSWRTTVGSPVGGLALSRPGASLDGRLLDLIDEVVEVKLAHLYELLHLGDLHLGVLLQELLNGHETAADAHHQPPRNELHVDLPRAEDVVAVAQSLDGHRLSERVEVLGNHLVDQVALDGPVPREGQLLLLDGRSSCLWLALLDRGGVNLVVYLPFQVLNKVVTVSQDLLQLLQLVLLLLQEYLQLLSAFLEAPDLLLEALVAHLFIV